MISIFSSSKYFLKMYKLLLRSTILENLQTLQKNSRGYIRKNTFYFFLFGHKKLLVIALAF